MPFSRLRRGVYFRDRSARKLCRSGIAGLLVAAVIGIIACSSDPTPTERPATPTQTPVPTPTDISVESVAELLLSIERSIEAIRGIDTPPPVEHLFVDQDGMRERLAEELTDPETLGQIEHEQALLKLLGVIPQGADLGALYEALLGGQVLGLYDPEKEEFFVLGDGDSSADAIRGEAELTYAHEYVHRLQDAQFDLEAIDELATDDDMSLAISALIEGDATSAQTQYMFANFDFGELSALLESALASQEQIPESPYFLQKSLEFPYTEGVEFVSALLQMGDFAAVDAVFADLPKSTEQIIHPEKYLDKESPIELDIPDDAMGDGWTVQGENVLGEFFLRTWLESLGFVHAGDAAAGWGGDAYAVFEDGSGESALAIFTAWDSNEEAREFMDGLSNAFADSDDYRSRGSGLDGILESWEGPGGYIVLSRWDAGDDTERVAVAISSEAGISHQLNLALATQQGLSN